MLVKDGMTSPVLTIGPDKLLSDAAALMAGRRVHQLPVVDPDGRLLGIITDRDLRDARAEPGFDARRVESAMTANPVFIRAEDTLEDALLLLHRRRFGALPVADRQGKVVGIFARHDCLRLLIDVLGINEPGSRVSVRVGDLHTDLVKAIAVLAEQRTAIISAVLARTRQDRGRHLFVRLQTIDPTPAAKALRDAGLTVEPARNNDA